MLNEIITFCSKPLSPFWGGIGLIVVGIYIFIIILELITAKIQKEKRE